MKKLKKIISGGQTGVDKAALDAAIELGFEHGGYCPKGRFNERGEIPAKYSNLIEVNGFFETAQENYDTRTKLNITYSDGTLILLPSLDPLPHIQDGTRLTQREVLAQGKPFLCIGLTDSVETNLMRCTTWIKEHHIEILNIAGPRESTHPSIEENSLCFLRTLLSNYHHYAQCK